MANISKTLKSYLTKRGSPLADHVPDLIRAGRRYRVDPRLIVAIANAETSLGKAGAGPAVHNAWGIGPGRAYQTWSQGIDAMAKLLRTGYLNDGRTSFASLYPKYVWGKSDRKGDPNASWVQNASATYSELGGNPNNVTGGWKNASAPGVTGFSYQPPPMQPASVLKARPSFDPLSSDLPLQAIARVAQGGSAVASFKSMVKAIDWAEKMAGPLAQKSPLEPRKEGTIAPNGKGVVPVSGKVIGTPNTGTHTLGNWESDNAVDIAVPLGTPIRAIKSGVIGSQFGSLGSGGRFAGLRLHLNARDNEYYYAHLSSFAPGIKPGARVKSGQIIGYSGEANGVPHLHFAEKNGNPWELYR